MPNIPGLKRIFRFPFRDRARIEREIDEELAFHLERRTEELIAAGHTPADARREARRQFGDLHEARRALIGLATARERRVRRREWFGELWRDVRHGARRTLRDPGFSAVAALTLALGIGANTAVFSVVNGVLLQPLDFPSPERLVRVRDTGERFDGRSANVNPMNLLDWREQADAFTDLGGLFFGDLPVTGPEGASLVRAVYVTVGALGALGIEPARGRAFTSEEYRKGGPPVLILSHAYWRTHLGGDPKALGRTLVVDGEPHLIVGVMPPGVRPPFSAAYESPRLWLPGRVGPHNGRGGHWLRAVARLAPGVSLGTAEGELRAIAGRLEAAYPESNRGVTVRLEPLRESLVGDARPALLVLLAGVGLVLLIACVNVANLLLARGAGRRTELGVRAALGASRGRLTGQLLIENSLLAGLGGALGVLLALWATGLLRSLTGTGIPRLAEIGTDLRVLGFALGATGLTALLIGLVPAFVALRRDPHEALRAAGRGGGPTRGARRLNGGLAVAQVALAVVLLSAAGLLIHSLARLSAVDPGFGTRNTIALRIVLPDHYAERTRRVAFLEELVRRARAMPGVRAAGAVDSPPFQFKQHSRSTFIPADRPEPPAHERPSAYESYVVPGYFETLGIPLLRGRRFDARDHAEASAVIIVNETLAERIWPGEDPVGERIRYNGLREVVGVVAATRRTALSTEPQPEMFIPYAQWPYNEAVFVMVRGRTAPETTIADFRTLLQDMDPTVPLGMAVGMDRLVSDTLATPRFRAILFGGFAALAVLLAVLGVYGVLSYAVSRRTHEFGIRMALGARPSDVLRLVLRQGLALTALGVALGLVGALGATRLLDSLLYGIRPNDPTTLAAVALLFILVAAAACLVPARRATRSEFRVMIDRF